MQAAWYKIERFFGMHRNWNSNAYSWLAWKLKIKGTAFMT
jgi:hypothetical protein